MARYRRNPVKDRSSPRCRKEAVRSVIIVTGEISRGRQAAHAGSGLLPMIPDSEPEDLPSTASRSYHSAECRGIPPGSCAEFFIGGIKMKLRNFVSAAAAFAAAVSAVSFCASAEETPAGYVYFMADKTTIGQGFVVQPEKVPLYEGDTGLDVVQRAADILTEDSGYGAYITAFADTDLGSTVPEAIAAVCPEMTGRNTEGYLGSMDYTPEGGWTYFINDEYAMTGIGDYIPADGDVILFEFTVYGYGADLGIDNSSWGGAAALKPLTNKAELIKLCAEGRQSIADDPVYTAAMETLAIYESTQEDIDNSAEAMKKALSAGSENAQTADAASSEAPENASDAADEKGSPSTGVEGAAVAFAAALLAGAGIALSKRK